MILAAKVIVICVAMFKATLDEEDEGDQGGGQRDSGQMKAVSGTFWYSRSLGCSAMLTVQPHLGGFQSRNAFTIMVTIIVID